MQTYNPRHPINFQELIVMADELHQALKNTIDTLGEIHDNGEWCPSCGGEYTEDCDLLLADHDETCSLSKAIDLYQHINTEGQLKAVKKLHKVSN